MGRRPVGILDPTERLLLMPAGPSGGSAPAAPAAAAGRAASAGRGALGAIVSARSQRSATGIFASATGPVGGPANYGVTNGRIVQTS